MHSRSNTDEPVIRIRDVTKIYPMGTIQVRALDGVSMDVREGEFVAIMGASGSGKSTLMNIIGCLDVPTAGSYHIDGQAIEVMSNDRLADIRSLKVGFVFQTNNLLPRLTALANVELPMMYGRWDPQARTRRTSTRVSRIGRSHGSSPDGAIWRTAATGWYRPCVSERAIDLACR